MKKTRGRPRADYKCAVSGRVCPLNEPFWEVCSGAEDECPIHEYQRGDYVKPDGTRVINDWCKHLVNRE